MLQDGNGTPLQKIGSVTIPARFKGPPTMANGGYACGLLAKYIEGVSDVMLKLPAVLDRELYIASNGEGNYFLLDGDQIVIQAKPGSLQLPVPDPPAYEEALAAAKTSIALKPSPHPLATGRGLHPICFCCGADVPNGEGLKIHPGRIEGRTLVAAPWTPAPEYGDERGFVHPEFIWTALDCPGAFALRELTDGKPGLSGRLIGQIEAPLRCGEPCVVAAWPEGSDGRKLYAGTALFNAEGRIVGRTLATWITMAPRS